MDRPDFAALLRHRLDHPAPLTIEADPASLGNAVLRQLEPDSAPGGKIPLRASAVGRCARQVGYRLSAHPEDGRIIDAKTRTNFALGDMTEIFAATALADALATGLAAEWTLEETRGQQLEVSLSVPHQGQRLEILGHPDGVLTHKGNPRAVLEIKSCTTPAFERWSQLAPIGDAWTPSDGYWWQLQTYIHALELEAGYVLAVCKDNGAHTGWWQEKDGAFPEMLAAHLARAASDDPPRQLPDGETLQPDAEGQLPWNCVYCPFWRSCWPEAEKVVKRGYNDRPKSGLEISGAKTDACS